MNDLLIKYIESNGYKFITDLGKYLEYGKHIYIEPNKNSSINVIRNTIYLDKELKTYKNSEIIIKGMDLTSEGIESIINSIYMFKNEISNIQKVSYYILHENDENIDENIIKDYFQLIVNKLDKNDIKKLISKLNNNL